MLPLRSLGVLALFTGAALSHPQSSPAHVFTTTCQGKTYTYNELAGFGSIPSDARDKFGDTISIGSSAAITNWKKRSTGKNKQTYYTGTLYGLPDRGWNTQGTQNTIPRVHTFDVTFTPPTTSRSNPSPLPPNLLFKYKSTILLTSPRGEPLTGLDPDSIITLPGFPPLPASTYPGDGFGGPGPGGQQIAIDAEGLVLNSDGTFWVSDEYGPYIYLFSPTGKLLDAIAPPDALLPLRNGTLSFSSDNPPIFDQAKRPNPTNPSQGRSNNQGFEGLTASPDGKELWVMLQSAGRLEGGQNAETRRHTRLLRYDISKGKGKAQKKVKYSGEWVVPLPTFTDGQGRTRVAAQSEIHYVSEKQLLVLPRDSGVGACTDSPTSVYRHVDVVDIGRATDVKGKKYDAFNASIASAEDGVLKPEITPATVCPWIDFNINAQLNKFGLRNGPPALPAKSLLNEKWESLVLVPVEDGKKDEYFLIAISDNDFITQNGFINNGNIPYKDASGCSLDQQALVFRVTLPKGSKPLVG
ncbi:esterase-like activity of phytase-domain-containing protein [Triangularia verruculosa]|uniref:Esterase-like activity of phytase-domain-containing protein n=1 Tax=Triangularia verruculosa TaxID=2587418 RepID=A0AAN7AQL9_9PEZI|nr:esterase-like activity of phytase-domain-containing protein [Triangularia verruculosa]